VPAVRGLSPEAQELAQRTYAVGVRSLVYGSLIGAVGVSFLVGYTLHTYQVGESYQKTWHFQYTFS